MIDYNNIINFKWGTEPFKRKKHGKLSNKWFFYKPNTGNLTPAPQSPFTSFNSNPYFGGYSSGYSIYEKCTWSTPRKTNNKKLIGFTHFTPSGSGDIKEFLNYFLIKPTLKPQKIKKEKYGLNTYEIKTKRYTISTIVNRCTINYSISTKDFVSIDPTYGGLNVKEYEPKKYDVEIKQFDDSLNILCHYFDLDVYFKLKLNKYDGYSVDENNIIVISGKKVEFTLSYSFVSFENIDKKIGSEYSNHAISSWQTKLDRIEIDAPKDITKLFYTALYTSLKRPHISFETTDVFDYMTLWDMYKTEFPLLFLLNKTVSKRCLEGFDHIWKDDHYTTSRRVAKFTKPYDNGQAICLANIILSMGKMYGIDIDYEKYKKYQKDEINNYLKNNLPFKPRYTYNLDLLDSINAFNNAYNEKLDTLDLMHKSLYDNNGVLLNTDGCDYYEGSNANYSFRVSSITEKRLEFTNKKELIKELDRFFGFTSKKCHYFNKPTNPNTVRSYGDKVRRFEGLNNEPDMESPYMYGLLKEYDKQNEVLNEIIKYSFSISNDGVPGNDDTGALSSWLVFNILGIYPLVGTNKFLIGCPQINSATIKLDNEFRIIINRKNKDSIYLKEVKLNNNILKDFYITIEDIKKGGILEITLK